MSNSHWDKNMEAGNATIVNKSMKIGEKNREAPIDESLKTKTAAPVDKSMETNPTAPDKKVWNQE